MEQVGAAGNTLSFSEASDRSEVSREPRLTKKVLERGCGSGGYQVVLDLEGCGLDSRFT